MMCVIDWFYVNVVLIAFVVVHSYIWVVEMRYANHCVDVETCRCPFCRVVFIVNPCSLRFHKSMRCLK